MQTNVIMPVLGMSQERGKIIAWLIKEGQSVQEGEPLLEVETDKAVAEIEAPATGVLTKVTALAGDDVPVGTTIAVIASAVDEVSASPPSSGRPAVNASPLAARMASRHNLDLALIQPSGSRVEKADVLAYLRQQEQQAMPLSSEDNPHERLLASPKARRLAAEAGVDLRQVRGSGPEGAVLAADVEATLASVQQKAGDGALEVGEHAKAKAADDDFVEGYERKDVSGLPQSVSSGINVLAREEQKKSSVWNIMVDRMVSSWRNAPHFFLMREVDASQLIRWRDISAQKTGLKITYTDILIKVVAAALAEHPQINSVYQDGKVLKMSEINIGVAAAVEDGLVVVVVPTANRRSLGNIHQTLSERIQRARSNKLQPADIAAPTFTISNLGMYAVDAFLAVLNPPQAAILAAGRIADRVVPVDGLPAVRPMLHLSLSFDHRAVDGARGAAFLNTLATFLEEPLTIF